MTANYKNPIQTALFLVLVGVCAALHIWKLPPALPLLQDELGIDLIESGFLLSSVQIAGMTLGLTIGLFAERIGLRRCVLIGLVILVLASVSAALFQSKTLLLISRAIEGCGFLMVVLPIPSLIKRIVPADVISRIMSFWGCYMPMGAVLILLGGSWLLSLNVSWSALWLLLSGLTFIMFLLVIYLVPSERQTVEKRSINSMVMTTLSTPRVWLVAVIFGAYAAQWSAVIGFLPAVYASAGVSGLMAGFLTALVAGSNIIGNLSAGRLLYRKTNPKKVIIISFSTMAVTAFIAFAIEVGPLVQFLAILLFSVVGGLIPATLFYLAVIFAPTPETTAPTIGWVQQGSSLGQFAGAPIVAWVVSGLGGWQWTWVAVLGFVLLGIAMALKLPRVKPTKL